MERLTDLILKSTPLSIYMHILKYTHDGRLILSHPSVLEIKSS